MKFKFLLAFMLGGATLASAQGFKDGIQYFRADQPEEAEIILTRTINDATTDKSNAYFFMGEIAVQRKNYANAKDFFEKGIQANPQNGFNYVGLGQIALQQGDKSAAENFFKQARGLDKKNAVLLTDIARSYYDADPVKYDNEIQKALKDAKKADKNCPAIYILEADMLAPTNIGEAAGYYELAMNADKDVEYPEAYVKYARTYFQVNPQFAIERLKKLLELHPQSALAQRELAEKYYDNNQLTMAAEQYGKYIQNPNHFKRDEQRYVGLLYFGKKYEESNALAAKILTEDPDNFFMKRMQFLNEAAMGHNEEALKKGEIFFASKGEFVPNDYTTFGEVYQNLGQDSIAVLQYEKAVELAPEKTSLLKDLSAAYTSAEMYDKAVEAQQKFIDAGDYTTNDLMVLARRYQNAAVKSEIGSPEREEYSKHAIETINQIYEKVPDNYQVILTRARILLIANNNEPNAEVAEAFKKVLESLDSDPENVTKRRNDYIFTYNQLGNYYLNEKDSENAKLYFTKFLEIDPDNEPLRKFVESMK